MRPGKIERLGPEAIEFIMRERLKGRTIDEIIAGCRKQFPTIPIEALPSRSRMGAFLKQIEATVRAVQQTHLARSYEAQAGTPNMPSHGELVDALREITRVLELVNTEARLTRERITLLAAEIAELRKARG